MRVAVAQHQDAEVVTAQDDGDAGSVGHFRIDIIARRFRAVLGEDLQGFDDLFHRHTPEDFLHSRATLHNHNFGLHFLRHDLLLADSQSPPRIRGRNHLHAGERELLGDTLNQVIPPGEVGFAGHEVHEAGEFHRLDGARSGHRRHPGHVLHRGASRTFDDNDFPRGLLDDGVLFIFCFRILDAVGPYLLGRQLVFLVASLDVLGHTADMVVVIMRQHHQIGRPDLLHLRHQYLAAPPRAAVDNDDAPLAGLLAFNDERVSVFYGQEMDFAHGYVVRFMVSRRLGLLLCLWAGAGKVCYTFGQGLISRRTPCPPNQPPTGLQATFRGQGL